MKNPLLQKCLLLAVIGLLLTIPLSMVERTIAERTSYRAEAIRAIAAGSAGEQSIVGPVLKIPVEEEFDDELVEERDGERRKRTIRRKRLHHLTVLPHQLNFAGDMKVEKRAYGLYDTAVFELGSTITGTFDMPGPAALPSPGQNARLTWGIPTLSLGIDDVRGIVGQPKILLGNAQWPARRGVQVEGMKTGFHASGERPADGKPESVPFRIELALAGTGSFGFVPLGDVSTAELRGNWPHPGFSGDFLPRSREVDEKGFSARWSTTALASTAGAGQSGGAGKGFLVRLVSPVDIYQQALRAAKYGILFIVLSFSAFFVFEHLKTLPIHPIQYLLVGLAQAIFFLLLTSLSEHVDFSLAYLVAALASIALIVVYLAAILNGWRRGLGFGGTLGLLYGALYGILRSEQNALLLGSLLLFCALAFLMLATRRLDWYRLGRQSAVQPSVDE